MNRSERKLLKAGVAAFDECDVKEVKITDHSVPHDVEIVKRATHIITADPKDQSKTFKDTKDGRSGWYVGSSASLTCPYTEDTEIDLKSDFNNHNGQSKAYMSVRDNAGLLACRTCQYSGLTQVEVSVRRREFADAEKERIEAFQRLQTAREALEIFDAASRGELPRQ